MLRILSVCGARPNFMKVAPLATAFQRAGGIEHILVHTGQHYDTAMDRAFFEDLAIPPPAVNLGVGSGTHAVQTARVMERIEPVLLETRPDAVLVVGDVNSTLAAALVACKLQIPVLHVEAGLRSFDRTMPEEINRVLTDAISTLLLVSEPAGVENLRREGAAPDAIHLVGNVMIDTLRAQRERARNCGALARLELSPGGYALLTLHRPANVDDPQRAARLVAALQTIASELPLVFPVHPRTRQSLQRLGLWEQLAAAAGVRLLEPQGYLDFLALMSAAAVVLTDSGGIQEETTVLDVPCLTLRDNTERPITLTHGTNRLVGGDPGDIVAAFREARRNPPRGRVPDLWDGRAAERITRIIVDWAAQRG